MQTEMIILSESYFVSKDYLIRAFVTERDQGHTAKKDSTDFTRASFSENSIARRHLDHGPDGDQRKKEERPR
jgi:hypothetical protein